MQLQLNLDIPALQPPIQYNDTIMLIGSCFTENMSERLAQHKFNHLANPHGILFNPISVADSLESYVEDKRYKEANLFYLNELWNSWDHHTRFSHIDKEKALEGINQSQAAASKAIKSANWLIITLGSSFQYYLTETGKPVANNHRAPSQWFEKRLLDTDFIINRLSAAIDKLRVINPGIQVLFTISPVRHIRDGVIDNNRSKARLIEAVHTICGKYQQAHYFPAYELVIDILRDYRYYDIDFVHPNYFATSFVWEQFVNACIGPITRQQMKEVQEISISRSHRPRFPETEAHKKFMISCYGKVEKLAAEHPYLDFIDELAYFKP
jgi:hypothetical protein